jgi:hypothetical protein
MTYEDFLDEVTTLLTEMYEELRTAEQAKLDATALHEGKQNRNQTQRKQQQRQVQKKKAT